MIPIQFKDTVARKYGYKDWAEVGEYNSPKSQMQYLEEAGLLYAQSKWNDGCKAQREICSSVAKYKHVVDEWGMNGHYTVNYDEIRNAPKPEFKP